MEEEFNEEIDSGEEDVDKVGEGEEHIWMKVVFRVAPVEEEEFTDEPFEIDDNSYSDDASDEDEDESYLL